MKPTSPLEPNWSAAQGPALGHQRGGCEMTVDGSEPGASTTGVTLTRLVGATGLRRAEGLRNPSLVQL